MITLKIDGKIVQVPGGAMVLEAARKLNIDIPSICHHEAVEPWGGCRLCLVEITHKNWGGWSGLVTACLYPVEEGLVVSTASKKVIDTRKTIIDLLLARCPNSPRIQELAREYGIEKTSFRPDKDRDNCILCGLCFRLCSRMGMAAISTAGRGAAKEVSTPLEEAPEDCIGCGVCHSNCPTFNIPMQDKNGIRAIWDRKFELIRCESCGKAYITREHAAYLCERENLPPEYFDACDQCKRVESAGRFGEIVKW